LNDAQREHYRHQLTGAGNYLNEISDKHPEYWSITAEIFALMAVMAEHAEVLDDADELLALMERDPDKRLDIIGDSLSLLLGHIPNSRD
jgi:hypothetical protein